MFSRLSSRAVLPGCGLFILSMVLLSACVPSGQPDVTAVPMTTPFTSATSAAGSTNVVYGISDSILLSDSATEQVQQFKAMKAMGITSVRVDASWAKGQPDGPESFDFASLDQIVASLHKVGLSADLIIDQTPSWAAVSDRQGTTWAQPASASAFAAWAGAVAARYADSSVVKYLEIWNEPNIVNFWRPQPDPAAYTMDLKAAYAAIKRVDPSIVVLSGGLAPAVNGRQNYNPRTFLKDMYTAGAKGSFDAVAYHPYSYPASPDQFRTWSAWSQLSETSPSLRSVMIENGDSAKKVWITEFGAPTSGFGNVGFTGQSNELVQAISLVKKLSWVGSFYIYNWADPSSLRPGQKAFGLLTDDGVQKPAYAAVSAALRAP
jgi:polysaccharide biosynthesis protein PslG